MGRRSFVRSLLAAVLLPLTGRAQARPATRRLLIQASPLAGFQYHHGGALWGRLRVGQLLDLVREPDNPHDQRAVRIEWRGRKLGYLPRVENVAGSQMLDNDVPLTASIQHLRESRNPWERVLVEVKLHG